VTNDDGPPSQQSSPYVHSLIATLQAAGHTTSVVLPSKQRSWIGKAHLAGHTVRPTYFRPGTLHRDDGTVHDEPATPSEGVADEWILLDGTPASCVQIGLHHFFQERGPVDLVLSGPNYGRNTTTVFALSSGTLGGALEAAVCGRRAIALSYAFSSRDHDPAVIAEASAHSVRLVEHLVAHWHAGVDVYSVNVPLEPGVSRQKILYTAMLKNQWRTSSTFEPVEAEDTGEGSSLSEHETRVYGEIESSTGERPADADAAGAGRRHRLFKWAPTFQDVFRSVEESEPGNDGWAVKVGYTSVTPLQANFMHVPELTGEIQLQQASLSAPPPPTAAATPAYHALVDYPDPYVQPLILEALAKQTPPGSRPVFISDLAELPSPSAPCLQWRIYESADFEHALAHPSTSLVNAYIIRKALIRKHYLSQTVESWITKRPTTSLTKHVKPTCQFELDYAEFLDDALIDCFELTESFLANEGRPPAEREWWILKPGMSDRGQGIRIFDSEERLRSIFEEWDPESDDEEEEEEEENEQAGGDAQPTLGIDNAVITSQLRHFVAQPYIADPLLLPSEGNRKFHVRTYVLAVGSLRVYVFREMLALLAEKAYQPPWQEDSVDDLSRHLTNTCIQDSAGLPTYNAVKRFWALGGGGPPKTEDGDGDGEARDWKDRVYEQICSVTGEIFKAAARGMLVHFQTLPNAFELFGVDFLVDARGTAWLLEINAFPDFKQTGDELRDRVVGRLFEAVVDAAVNPFFGLRSEAAGLAVKEETALGLRLVTAPKLGRK
ncbi:hypothetical protein KEM52_002062, partial [Ascosphaera acerosa]